MIGGPRGLIRRPREFIRETGDTGLVSQRTMCSKSLTATHLSRGVVGGPRGLIRSPMSLNKDTGDTDMFVNNYIGPWSGWGG